MTTTTNIKLSTPPHGANVDTWDADPINNNSAILDAAFGTVTSKALTNVNVTLSATEAQAATIRLSGILTGNVTINVGAIIKEWNIQNLTTGNFVVTISGGSGNVVGTPQGQIVKVLWDGTNCYFTDLPHFIGAYWDDSGASVPTWVTACTVPPYLLCDGTTFSAVTYPYLNTKLGGTTLPDFRGSMGAFLNGGTARITTAGSGIDGDTRFSSGGAQNVTLSTAQLPTTVGNGGTFTSLINGGSSFANVWTGNLGGGATAGGSGPNPTAFSTISVSTSASLLTNSTGGNFHTNMPPTTISGIRMIRAA